MIVSEQLLPLTETLLKMSFANRRDSYVCKGQLHENRVKFGDIDMMFRMQ